MRQIFYALLVASAIIYTFSYSRCGGGKQNMSIEDSTKEKRITNNGTTTPELPIHKRLVFFNTETLAQLKDTKDLDKLQKNGFIPVDKSDYVKYSSYFESIFNIGNPSSSIADYIPRGFLIFDKYNDLQHYLGVREVYADPATKKIENWLRIYPALDASKMFYLVFMAEKIDKNVIPKPDTVTDRRVYYALGSNGLEMVPLNQMTQTEIDIRNFQTVWGGLNDPLHTDYYFDKVNSFSYSISEYNELLGNTEIYFWNLDKYKTDSKPRKEIRIVPIIDTMNIKHIKLRLVLLPYLYNFLGNPKVDDNKAYFDNMFPCPSICPSNQIN